MCEYQNLHHHPKLKPMENILDYDITEKRNEKVMYATFWTRVGASLIDFLVLVILVPITIYNMVDWKSIPILVVSTAVSILYKPVMEYKYGATVGKMAAKIKVTNYEFQNPNLQEIILRNIFHLSSGIINLVMSLYIFSLPEFGDVETYRDYQTFVAASKSSMLSIVLGLITIVDVLFMFSDSQNRTLHDKIGKTLVLKREVAY